jgi:hypothetical protein
MRIISRLIVLCTVALGSAVVVPADAAHAVSADIVRINAPGIASGVLYVDQGGYCMAAGTPNAPTGQQLGYNFDSSGRISIPISGALTNTLSCNRGSAAYLRAEVYPVPFGASACGAWDPFTSPAGGAHLQQSPGTNIGTVNLPAASTGGIKPMGKVLAAAGISGNCRIVVDLFQSTGFVVGGKGAFGSFYANRGSDLTTGWIFPGDYSMFITDTATGTKIRTETSFNATTPFDIDLDASCFGFDLCSYEAGAPPATGGGFHPLPPARILDTRSGVGIANGRVRAGDGSLPTEPNPDMRLDEANNHQTKVTGFGGVPEHGVSAVLLNVTVDQPSADSWLAVYPKLPRRSIFEDQSWFRTEPGTSNLNFGRMQSLPNLVLARVGAGGRIMLENYAGELNAIADVVGWFDTGTGGDGFTGVTPERILDTRNPGNGGAFGPKQTRSLSVINRANVPADATAVVLNVTQIDATSFGYLTVWPSGLAQPDTSNLNGAPGRTRPNLVVAKVGAGGKVDIFNFDGQSHVAVDVVGYFSPRGGKVYPLSPVRIMDSRSGFRTSSAPFGAAEVRNLVVTGVGGVPANATAIIANVTGTQSTYGSFLTVFPTGTKLPATSNVNLELGAPAPNLVMMKIGAGGQISIYNDRGLAHVIVDVMGYVL